jgi:hypothetical protein
VFQLSFEEDKDGQRRRKAEDAADESHTPPLRKRRRAPAPEVGHALRSAYQRTLDEHIPPEMLDLLGKLG